MNWIRITALAQLQDARDRAAALLIDAGAAGVQEHDDRIVTYLADDVDVKAVAHDISAMLPDVRLTWEDVGDIPTDTTWTAAVGIQRIGALTVTPPWLEASCEGESGVIVIDPATAFGTGEHPSTRLVLRCMQQVVRPGDRVADLGAGSAVLSIAAALLGARSVAAIELDAGSIGNAEENVQRNGVADQVRVVEGDASVLLPLVAPVRVVLANILSSVILRLEAVMRRSLDVGGEAVLGGVLVAERDDLVRALTARGWQLVREDTEGDWWSGVITPA